MWLGRGRGGGPTPPHLTCPGRVTEVSQIKHIRNTYKSIGSSGAHTGFLPEWVRFDNTPNPLSGPPHLTVWWAGVIPLSSPYVSPYLNVWYRVSHKRSPIACIFKDQKRNIDFTKRASFFGTPCIVGYHPHSCYKSRKESGNRKRRN